MSLNKVYEVVNSTSSLLYDLLEDSDEDSEEDDDTVTDPALLSGILSRQREQTNELDK